MAKLKSLSMALVVIVVANSFPTVSIIVPMYNVEETIEKCLESLTHLYYPRKYEVILVNNRSSDNTAISAKKYKVKLIDACKLQGSYYARNVGLVIVNPKSSHSQIPILFLRAEPHECLKSSQLE